MDLVPRQESFPAARLTPGIHGVQSIEHCGETVEAGHVLTRLEGKYGAQ